MTNTDSWFELKQTHTETNRQAAIQTNNDTRFYSKARMDKFQTARKHTCSVVPPLVTPGPGPLYGCVIWSTALRF